MSRILADLPNEDIEWLDARAAEQGKSRASILREAVQAYRADAPKDWLDAGFGAWKDRTDIGDAVEWQRRERASWTRPWDVDYEEAKAEYPDLFDAEDDREHAIHKAWLAKHGESFAVDPDAGTAAGSARESKQSTSAGRPRSGGSMKRTRR